MPETLSIAKTLLKQVDITRMHRLNDTYRSQEVCGVYAGVTQRGIIVYSQQADDRFDGSRNRIFSKNPISDVPMVR